MAKYSKEHYDLLRQLPAPDTQRPGIILYFDDLGPSLKRMSNEQLGILLREIIAYAQTGEVTEISDPLIDFAMDSLKPAIDRDGETYKMSYWAGKYSAALKTGATKQDNLIGYLAEQVRAQTKKVTQLQQGDDKRPSDDELIQAVKERKNRIGMI